MTRGRARAPVTVTVTVVPGAVPFFTGRFAARRALVEICQRLRTHGSVVEVSGMNRQGRGLVSRPDLGID